MRKGLIYTIFVLITASLIGIVVTQVFWIRNAYHLKEELFNRGVAIALKSVATAMELNDGKGFPGNMDLSNVEVGKRFDSLFLEEMGCMRIDEEVVYGIYQKTDGKFIFGGFANYEKELRRSAHAVSLAGKSSGQALVLAAFYPRQQSIVLRQLLGWMILSGVFTLILCGAFVTVVKMILRQKKHTEMKTDFVNNMTHELRTPISTISLASEMLLKPTGELSRERIRRYARVIRDENLRLKRQVEQVLQISLLDRGKFRLKPRQIDVHQVIEERAKTFSLQMAKRGGQLDCNLQADFSYIFADRVHFVNVLTNVLDNANKYSPQHPDIRVSTRNSDDGIVISVEDKGGGISKENQELIFKKLYRVPTGNIHDVKGFGLGLYYVKTMVEAHGGWVSVKSEPRKGSRFDMFFPFNYKENKNAYE